MGFKKSLSVPHCTPVSGASPRGWLESFIFQYVLQTILSMGTWARWCPCVRQSHHPHLTGENTLHREGQQLLQGHKSVQCGVRTDSSGVSALSTPSSLERGLSEWNGRQLLLCLCLWHLALSTPQPWFQPSFWSSWRAITFREHSLATSGHSISFLPNPKCVDLIHSLGARQGGPAQSSAPFTWQTSQLTHTKGALAWYENVVDLNSATYYHYYSLFQLPWPWNKLPQNLVP